MTQAHRFHFERLEVFTVAREALAHSIRCRAAIAGLPGELASQFERAMISVVANIAEGAGRYSRADKQRHYAIARGSANEAGAVLSVAGLYGRLSDEDQEQIRSRLLRVTWMLTALLRR